MTTRAKKAIAAAGLLVLVTVLAARGIWVNRRFAADDRVTVPAGQSYLYGDVAYTIEETNIQTLQAFCDANPDMQIDTAAYTANCTAEEVYLACVSLQVSNPGQQTTQVPLYSLYLSDHVWYNGMDMELFTLLNSGQNILLTLEGGTSVSLQLPYLLYKPQFTEKRWKQADQKEYFLILSTYPACVELCTARPQNTHG